MFLSVVVFISLIFFIIFLRTVFSVSSVCSLRLPVSPLSQSEGRESEGRAGKANMEVQVKITTPDLS